jgi:hypothetical protein
MDRVESESGIPEGTPQVRRRHALSAEAMEALSQAIHRELKHAQGHANGDGVEQIDEALGHALRRISAEARAGGMTAEQLLVVLKGLLDSIPDLRLDGVLSTAESAHPLRTSLVSACIRAYYRGD